MARPTTEETERRLKERAAKKNNIMSDANVVDSTVKGSEKAKKSDDSKHIEPPKVEIPKSSVNIDPESVNKEIKEEAQTYMTDPLLEAKTISRDYTKPPVEVMGHIPDSVPEFEIEQPILDFREKREEIEQPKPDDKPKIERGEIRNPAFDEMSNKGKTESARMLAKSFVGYYQVINEVAKNFLVKTDVAKLEIKAVKGEFDMDALSVSFPISETQYKSVSEIIQHTNESADEIFTCDDDFNRETEDLWTIVLKESGLGMTPSQRLMSLYAEDLGKKAFVAFGLYNTNKQILELASNHIKTLKEQSGRQQSFVREQVNVETDASTSSARANNSSAKKPKVEKVEGAKKGKAGRKPNAMKSKTIAAEVLEPGE